MLLLPVMGWELWRNSQKAARADCKMQWVKLILQETSLSRMLFLVFPGTSEKFISRINTVARLMMNMPWFSLWHYLLPQNIKSSNSSKLFEALYTAFATEVSEYLVLSSNLVCLGLTKIPRIQQTSCLLQSQWASSSSHLYSGRDKKN